MITSSATFLNSLKEEMKLDIDSLASASFKLPENQKWSVDGEFRKVTDEEDMDIDIWVFQHTTHMYASNCYYRNFESFFCIYTKRGEFRVCSKPDHKVLTCFFHDNLALLEVYKHKFKKKEVLMNFMALRRKICNKFLLDTNKAKMATCIIQVELLLYVAHKFLRIFG